MNVIVERRICSRVKLGEPSYGCRQHSVLALKEYNLLFVNLDTSSCTHPIPIALAGAYPKLDEYHQKISFRYWKPFHSFWVNRSQKAEWPRATVWIPWVRFARCGIPNAAYLVSTHFHLHSELISQKDRLISRTALTMSLTSMKLRLYPCIFSCNRFFAFAR